MYFYKETFDYFDNKTKKQVNIEGNEQIYLILRTNLKEPFKPSETDNCYFLNKHLD